MPDKTPYGPKSEVKYADPGLQSDNVARYPIDTEEHVRAAWSYINMPKNANKYNSEQLEQIKNRIRAAAKEYGIQIAEEASGKMSMDMETADQGALLAGAAPLSPPSTWFADPGLSAPTKMTIDEDGHVFGHLAQWKVCHVGVGKACVMAPKSRTNYGLFHQGTVVCDNGAKVAIGKIVLGTAHANAHYGVMPTREHYDNTGLAAAVVTVGEDRHGIWVNGALTSTMTPEKVAELRASALSGDWRMVNGNLELIAALAVNSPGFPIYREQGGHAFSLMAVGVVGQDDEPGEFSMSAEPVTDDVVDAEFDVDEAEVEEDELTPEMAARMERIAEIEESWEQHLLDKKLAQLAVLDQEREAIGTGPYSDAAIRNRIFIQNNARVDVLDEDEDDEE